VLMKPVVRMTTGIGLKAQKYAIEFSAYSADAARTSSYTNPTVTGFGLMQPTLEGEHFRTMV
jgi:hypothetical protein